MAALTNALLALSKYHPIVIEGMGGYDPRDPKTVASHVVSRLRSHWETDSSPKVVEKPKLVIIQGDPLEERGISAITPIVAKELQTQRGLVLLDDHIADYHARDADYDNVILQMKYTEMVNALPSEKMAELEQTVDQMIHEKNQKRDKLGKPPLKDYFRDFALLQEITKGACREICGDITVAHTAHDISEFSVTSFYTAGLGVGLLQPEDFVTYEADEELDFDELEKVRYGSS
jgi:hypothetical protein